MSGCLYKDVFDYSTGWKAPYNSNPNWGRRKRQTGDCQEIAKVFAEKFPQYKGLSEEIVNWICSIDTKFVKGAVEAMNAQIENLNEAEEVRGKIFNEKFTPEAKRDIDQEKADTVRNF